MNIIVATNVAARGLDIRGVEHVVNYDLVPIISTQTPCQKLYLPNFTLA